MKPMTKAELKTMIKNFMAELKKGGVQFSMAYILSGGKKHDGAEHINANDDHHVLDLINNQMQLWTKLNHKGVK